MFAQTFSITLMNLRSLPARTGASLVVVVGIAGVVIVLVALLAMSTGFRAALESTGQADRALLMRSGSTQEMNSWVPVQGLQIISGMEGVAAVSGEVYVALDLRTRTTGKPGAGVGRGVDAEAFAMRPELRIVDGRPITPGRNEMLAGLGAVSEYLGLEVGAEVELRNSVWRVVGHFDGGGAAYANEVWMDLSQAQATFRRAGGVSSARIRLDNQGIFDDLRTRIGADPRVNLDLTRETDFYAEQSRSRAELINAFAVLVASIMAAGSIVAALNTMFASVGSRSVEIATLRALGFGRFPIVISVLAEAMLLALIGSLLGGALVYLLFDGYAASTLNGNSYSQVAFNFSVTPDLLVTGVICAMSLGLIGGLLPAWRASRLPVAAALRGA